jgi:tetratricopeptide (TPR) repeat protein
MAKKKLPQTEEQYPEIVKKSPDHPLRLVQTAQLQAAQGNWARASAILEEAHRKNPRSLPVLSALIQSYVMIKRPEKAIGLCEDLVKQNPNDAAAWNMLGKLYGTNRDLRKAQAAFEKAGQLQPDWTEPMSNLARVYLAEGRKDEAVKKFEQSIAKSPKAPGPYLFLGMIYEQSNEYAKAADIYQRALAQIPTLWVAANNLAFVLSEHPSSKADLDRAVAFAKKARDLKPREAVVLDTLAWAYYRKGENKLALAEAKQAVALAPDNPVHAGHLGLILLKEGRKAEAKQHLAAALKDSEPFPGRQEAERAFKDLGK